MKTKFYAYKPDFKNPLYLEKFCPCVCKACLKSKRTKAILDFDAGGSIIYYGHK